MTVLSIDNQGARCRETIRDGKAVAGKLAEIGVHCERGDAEAPLAAETGQDEVLQAYQESIATLNLRYGAQCLASLS